MSDEALRANVTTPVLLFEDDGNLPNVHPEV